MPLASARSRMSMQQLEQALVRQAVDAARGNVAEAARALGLSRATVYRKLAQPPQPSQPPDSRAGRKPRSGG